MFAVACSTGCGGCDPCRVELPFVDDFERADGPVGNGWVDLSRRWPSDGTDGDGFNPALIFDGKVGTGSGDPGEDRAAAWRACCTKEGYSVRTTFSVNELLGSQCGPLAFVTAGPHPLGLALYYNVSFGQWYIVEVGDDYSDRVILDTNPADYNIGGGQTVEAELRSLGGQIAAYIDGRLVAGPVTIPVTLQGSKRHGFYLGSQVEDRSIIGPGVIESCEIHSNTAALDTYTAPTIGEVGASAEATSGSSINVPYPATVTAGRVLVCCVANSNNRSWTAPSSPWQTVNNGGAGQFSGMFYKVADGTETGNLTVNASGAMTNARGVMFEVTNVNEASASPISGNGGVVTASTQSAAASLDQTGMHRGFLLFSWSNTNQTHTHPAGWTPVATYGDGTPAGVLKVSWRKIDAFAGGNGVATGTQTVDFSGSCNSRVIHAQILPQPY